MKRITKIEGNAILLNAVRKTRVAAYCRVSTGSDEQLLSLETQKDHYERYIKAHLDWEYAGLYYDQGITGTKKDKRPALMQMVADCEDGRIDRVITKSISRFCRNTTDCLELVRKLLGLGIPIYFEKEDLDTGSMESELMLSILSSLAESESVSIAENSKWSIRRRFENGTFKLAYPPYGYDYIGDGEWAINEEQAKWVRFIYSETLSGKGSDAIAAELIELGAPTKKGGKWTSTSVRGILSNEKYTGDCIFQKTYTVDFLEKKRVPNNGLVLQYYVENSHEAIIPRELYMQVQEEMVRRANLHSGQNRKKRVYSSKYALSSIVYCSKCGDIYRRVVWNNRGKHSIVWRCCTRVEHGPGACNADAIHESELQNLVVRAINMALGQKDTMYDVLQRNVEAVLTGTDGISLDEIDARLEELQRELLNVANAKGNYDSIVDEIYMLREAKQNAQVEGATREGMKQRISEMQQFLAEQTQDITEYDEQLVRRLIEKIMVYDEKVIVEFKSGTSVDVRR